MICFTFGCWQLYGTWLDAKNTSMYIVVIGKFNSSHHVCKWDEQSIEVWVVSRQIGYIDLHLWPVLQRIPMSKSMLLNHFLIWPLISWSFQLIRNRFQKFVSTKWTSVKLLIGCLVFNATIRIFPLIFVSSSALPTMRQTWFLLISSV